MEWELLDKYLEQDKKANELTAKYEQKVRDAKENVTAAIAVYEGILQREFAGEEVAAEKQKALDNIDRARSALKVMEEEKNKAYDYAHKHIAGKITIDDLADDWNDNVVPNLREERVVAITQQAYDGLKAYYDAVQDLMNLNNEYAAVKGEIQEKFRGRKGTEYRYLNEIANFNDLPTHPTDADWITILKYRKVPTEYRDQEETENV